MLCEMFKRDPLIRVSLERFINNILDLELRQAHNLRSCRVSGLVPEAARGEDPHLGLIFTMGGLREETRGRRSSPSDPHLCLGGSPPPRR